MNLAYIPLKLYIVYSYQSFKKGAKAPTFYKSKAYAIASFVVSTIESI